MNNRLNDIKEVRQEVFKYSRLQPYKFFRALIFDWILIAVCVILIISVPSLLLTLFCILVIASRQHSLGVLMHEAVHYRVMQNRSIAEVVSNLFCALPLGMLTSKYRYEHLLHHKYNSTSDDPYIGHYKQSENWKFPKTAKSVIRLFLKDLSMLNFRDWKIPQRNWSPFSNAGKNLTKTELATVIVFTVTLLTMLTVFNLWLYFALVWLVPLLFVVPVLVRIRTVAEHMLLTERNRLDETRHVDSNVVEGFFISPRNINVHVVHHLYPSIPFYNLLKLHKFLLSYQKYTDNIDSSKSYLKFIRTKMIKNKED